MVRFLILGMFIIPQVVVTESIEKYLVEVVRLGRSDYKVEQEIIAKYEPEAFFDELSEFYSDSLVVIRQKAYYLTYRFAKIRNVNRSKVVKILLKGCFDGDGGIVGQNVGYLKRFNREDFDTEALNLLKSKLSNHRVSHYKDFVLLAGFLGVGKDILYQKFIDGHTSSQLKWSLSLALARMGNTENVSYCMDKIRNIPIKDNFIDYVVSDLIYTRQRDLLDVCIKILYNDEKLCHSLNPDISESVLCGYRVLEMLAPVIDGIPVTVDSYGLSNFTNYEDQLLQVRLWFTNHADYKIKNDEF